MQFNQKQLGTERCQFGYYEILPENYKNEKLPIIIFFHGIGVAGNGTTELPKLLNEALPKCLKDGSAVLPEKAIIIAPQTKTGFLTTDNVKYLVDYFIKKYNVDQDRIYITGMSSGSVAAFLAAYNYTDKVAAVLACAIRHYPDPPNPMAVKNLPVLIVTNEGDKPDAIKATLDAFKLAGAALKVDLGLGNNHNSWDRCYTTKSNFEWLFSQSKATAQVTQKAKLLAKIEELKELVNILPL